MVGRSACRVCPSGEATRRPLGGAGVRACPPAGRGRGRGSGPPSVSPVGRSGQVGPPPFAERGPGGSRGAESVLVSSCVWGRVAPGRRGWSSAAGGEPRESHEERQSARRRQGVRGGVPPPPPPRLWAALLSLEAVVLRPPPARPARASCLSPPLLSPGRPFSSSLIFPLGGRVGSEAAAGGRSAWSGRGLRGRRVLPSAVPDLATRVLSLPPGPASFPLSRPALAQVPSAFRRGGLKTPRGAARRPPWVGGGWARRRGGFGPPFQSWPRPGSLPSPLPRVPPRPSCASRPGSLARRRLPRRLPHPPPRAPSRLPGIPAEACRRSCVRRSALVAGGGARAALAPRLPGFRGWPGVVESGREEGARRRRVRRSRAAAPAGGRWPGFVAGRRGSSGSGLGAGNPPWAPDGGGPGAKGAVAPGGFCPTLPDPTESGRWSLLWPARGV